MQPDLGLRRCVVVTGETATAVDTPVHVATVDVPAIRELGVIVRVVDVAVEVVVRQGQRYLGIGVLGAVCLDAVLLQPRSPVFRWLA